MLKNFVVSLFYASFAFCAVEPLNVLNFAATNGANDIVKQNDTLWIATNGGLAQFQSSSENFIALHHSHQHFPDISLSALCVDGDILWIGSENGYLYRRQRRGQKIYDDLFVVKSKINVIKPYENYLIIGHEKGMSVFDAKKGKIISTKRNFDGFGAGGVSLIEIKNDTLWAVIKSGATNGVVKLEKFSSYIKEPKFGDDSPLAQQVPWQTLENSLGEVKTLIYQNGIEYFEIFNLLNEEYRDRFANDITFAKELNGKIVFGTKFDFVWFQEKGGNLVVPGLSGNMTINRLFVDGENSLWIIPTIRSADKPWWNRVERITKEQKFLGYNGYTQYFGTVGDCPDFLGIAQYDENTIFLSNCSEPLKEYNLKNDTWRRWVFDTENFTNKFYDEQDFKGYPWTKIDALFRAASGVVWGTYWRNANDGDVELPVVFAFHPKKNNLRFLLKGRRVDLIDPYKFASLGNGDLLLGFKNTGELWLIDGSKDPFDENFDDKIESLNGYLKSTIKIDDNTMSLAQTGAGNVLVGTAGIPVVYSFDKNTRQSKKFYIENLPEKFIARTNDVVLEYSDTIFGFNDENMEIRNVFWFANASVGVERAVISEYLLPSGALSSVAYDTAQTIFALNPTNGGINQEAFSLAVDTVQNFLWVGGDKGLTRIRLPQRIFASSQTKNDFLFPNPFSLSRHEFISISGGSQNSLVDIYTVSGKLVAHLDEKGSEWTKNIDGNSFYRWKTPKTIAPGTYIVAVKEYEGDRIARKKTKTYKLVVIP
jgi:hypothetical protein